MKRAKAKLRRGVLAGGNWIIDQVKLIDVYPDAEHLANIRGQSEGTGGAPYNVLADLAGSQVDFPLFAAGLVGRDNLGDQILRHCRQLAIDTRHLQRTARAPTSYTDVMTEQNGGRRTFFHARGANALWNGHDLDFARIPARIFHLGYLLLLDTLDQPDRRFGTAAARLLAQAQNAGLKVSIDVVSENSNRFAQIVNPALKHVDYCILNEFEAGQTTGRTIRQASGRLDQRALHQAAGDLLQRGVRELVVIHFPEGAYARSAGGQDAWQSSLRLPRDYIAGTAGAGDAFCAGVLIGLHEGWPLERSLATGVCVAAASLAHPTCTAGVKSLASSLALGRKFGFRKRPKE